eukprot:CAMPEP_0184673800 /NCGR_PEP_ID=MMETSP0308-20130426/86882_1 /TAXON_ID=38269 /ORGANISM="Gloeochaete witrockiana, Strain SAG 46.84" /LENGTH=733 /DNA_ID=CAMNT_0027121327 /DNA_START=772 /DNA_END=2970 /DNA_ORIENTATION=-
MRSLAFAAVSFVSISTSGRRFDFGKHRRKERRLRAKKRRILPFHQRDQSASFTCSFQEGFQGPPYDSDSAKLYRKASPDVPYVPEISEEFLAERMKVITELSQAVKAKDFVSFPDPDSVWGIGTVPPPKFPLGLIVKLLDITGKAGLAGGDAKNDNDHMNNYKRSNGVDNQSGLESSPSDVPSKMVDSTQEIHTAVVQNEPKAQSNESSSLDSISFAQEPSASELSCSNQIGDNSTEPASPSSSDLHLRDDDIICQPKHAPLDDSVTSTASGKTGTDRIPGLLSSIGDMLANSSQNDTSFEWNLAPAKVQAHSLPPLAEFKSPVKKREWQFGRGQEVCEIEFDGKKFNPPLNVRAFKPLAETAGGFYCTTWQVSPDGEHARPLLDNEDKDSEQLPMAPFVFKKDLPYYEGASNTEGDFDETGDIYMVLNNPPDPPKDFQLPKGSRFVVLSEESEAGLIDVGLIPVVPYTVATPPKIQRHANIPTSTADRIANKALHGPVEFLEIDHSEPLLENVPFGWNGSPFESFTAPADNGMEEAPETGAPQVTVGRLVKVVLEILGQSMWGAVKNFFLRLGSALRPALNVFNKVKASLLAMVVGLCLAVGVRTYVAECRWIPSKSMLPTLQVDDRVVVNKLVYKLSNKAPERHDIVVFRAPNEELKAAYGEDAAFVKRIIGLPGETVEVKQGIVYVNGAPLDEGYVHELANYRYGPKTVPQDCYLVLGDNRNESYDSHAW